MRRHTLLALPLVLAGCFYPADRGRVLEEKVQRLEAQLREESRLVREKLDSTLPRVEEKLAEMNKALQSLDTAARRKDADIGVQLQKTVEDLAQLRGELETYLHRLEQLERARPGTVAPAEPPKKAEPLARPTDKQAFLKLAQDKARAGEVELARQLFTEFLQRWAKDALGGEAHFGLGETYFNARKCREALFEYRKVLEDFSKSPAAPEAYLRSADCFLELKMEPESRLALEELVRNHPRSEAAKAAKARLEALDKARKGKK